MKGVFKKCFGVLLVCCTIFMFSLNVCLDVNALKHEYVGIPYFSPEVPISPGCYIRTNGVYLKPAAGFDGSCASSTLQGLFTPFTIKFEGDSYNSAYRDLLPRYNSSFINFDINGDFIDIEALFDNAAYGDTPSSETPNDIITMGHDLPAFYSSGLWNMSTLNSVYAHRNFSNSFGEWFNDSSVPNYLQISEPFGYYSTSTDFGGNGVINGTFTPSNYVQGNVLPYWYSSNGFYLHSKAIDSDGVHYSNTFSFNDLFNSYIPSFSYLSIPLHDYDGYFWDHDELYAGRSFEIGGSFDFDGSFAWHSDINTNGSYFRLYYDGMSDTDLSNPVSGYVDCTTNFISITGLNRLEYSCPMTLPASFNFLALSLRISGNGNYVWLTDNTWRFNSTFLISDHDSTPGRSFNSDLTGGGTIPGNASNNIDSADQDWFSSLLNMFHFDFINPFAPLFQLFSDNSSCANIPIIAGMLNSNETQVCPWFPASVRNILTPVFGLASVMLIFGFAVRWLGSSSGNMFEDSFETNTFQFRNKYTKGKGK